MTPPAPASPNWLRDIRRVHYTYPSTPEQTQANGLLVIARFALAAAFAALAALLFTARLPTVPLSAASFPIYDNLMSVIFTLLVSLYLVLRVGGLVNRGSLRRASVTLVIVFYLVALSVSLPQVLDSALMVVWSMPVVAAGVLLDRVQLMRVGAASLVTLALLAALNAAGILRPNSTLDDIEVMIYLPLVLAADGFMLRVFAGQRFVLLQERLSLTGRLEESLRQVRELNASLEQRVSDRTRDLEVGVAVSRQMTTVLDLGALLALIVTSLRERFGIDAADIYLYHEEQQALRLAYGSSGAPLALALADDALAARAARTREAQVERGPNGAAMALPMRFGVSLMGALVVTSANTQRFGPEDARVLGALAAQTAIAVRNANLFQETEAALHEANRANEVKSAFLASMSHELRTPLNAIINFTLFIQRGKMGPVNERQVETLEKVRSSGVHLLNLINDVLDISKIESGSLTLLVDRGIMVSELVERVRGVAEALLANRPIALNVEIEPDLPTLTGDRQRLLQILLNIVANACKFTEQGAIAIRAYRDGDDVCMQVSDTGPGIPPDQHAAVFEAFKQTDTGLQKGEGTGLGMPISKRLAEAHGGRILLESVPGQGAAFTVLLPIVSPLQPSFEA